MVVKITEMKARPFQTDEGEMLEYFWYKAIRLADQVSFQFGSMNGGHGVGEELDLEIEKTEAVNKKGEVVFRYKETAG